MALNGQWRVGGRESVVVLLGATLRGSQSGFKLAVVVASRLSIL